MNIPASILHYFSRPRIKYNIPGGEYTIKIPPQYVTAKDAREAHEVVIYRAAKNANINLKIEKV